MENIKGENRNEIDSTPTINEDNVDDLLAELMFDEPPKVPWSEALKALKAMIERLGENEKGTKP